MGQARSLVIVLAAVAAATTLAAPAWSEDAEGKKAFAPCAACHRIGDKALHAVGPQLNDIIGRTAGTAAGFRYSAAMKKAGEDGMVWTPEMLDRFLTKPKDVVAGNRMPFGGIPDKAKRTAIIDYLGSFAGVAAATSAASNPCDAIAKSAAALPADRDYGEYLAGECVTCHQVSGHADGIPAITRMPPEVFVGALCEYRTKHRTHPVMNMVAAPLNDSDMAALAAFFASLD
jgi:cytochrome c